MLLRLGKTRVVVEIKRPSELDDRNKRRRALQEVGRYIRDLGLKYGIVTDGYNWIYVAVRPFASFYWIHQLLRFHTKEHETLALRALERSKKATLRRLLELLHATHGDMTVKYFNYLMGLGDRERILTLVNRAKTKIATVTTDERQILRELYRENRGNDMVKPLLASLPLTKK